MVQNERKYDISIQHDPESHLTDQASTVWAAEYFAQTLQQKQLSFAVKNEIVEDSNAVLRVLISATGSGLVEERAQQLGLQVPEVPEAFAMFSERSGTGHTLTVAGYDARGLLYALLELADIVKYSADPLRDLAGIQSYVDKPHNPVRSITRLFSSEIEDKAWFYDRHFWDEYLTELAGQRFNQFTFSVGAAYDYLIDKIVMDTYFCFIYPFLFSVPGYEAEVTGLSKEEQLKNLEMLQYIGKQAKLRGLQFRVGLWNHAYDYGPDNTNKVYAISGLDSSTHAPYCREALTQLLEACPEIDGVVFRVHFEGGVPEPTHDFWRVVLSKLPSLGRQIEIDFHAKGVDKELIDIALGTGMNVVMSPKYWAEHLGPAYHQASIRDKEFYPRDPNKPNPFSSKEAGEGTGMKVTASRSFTRYGYADYLTDQREYGILHRVWPGTQRLLTWGDPASAAGYGRSGTFEGSLGFEWFEPLSFKGRKGSGTPGGRELYADPALQLSTRDWSKYTYTYRLWGRLTYNPSADPESWRRYLRSEFQGAALANEAAMAAASRILPFALLVHGPSGACNAYWPEMYTNMPLIHKDLPPGQPYRSKYGFPANYDFDTQDPYTFGSSSPFDPVLIYKISEFAEDVLNGKRKGKYSPLEVADIMEQLADSALSHLAEAKAQIADPQQPSFRRWAVDVEIMAGIGHFFAHKFRAGLAFELFLQTEKASLLKEALASYTEARDAWKRIIEVSQGVYKDNLAFGLAPFIRGHWSDRLAAIEEDIAEVDKLYRSLPEPSAADTVTVSELVRPFEQGERPAYLHTPVTGLVKGAEAPVEISFADSAAPLQVRLHYRHVNQSELYRQADMVQAGGTYTAVIPQEYTASPYSIQYFFEIGYEGGDRWLAPGFAADLSGQPYYVIHS